MIRLLLTLLTLLFALADAPDIQAAPTPDHRVGVIQKLPDSFSPGRHTFYLKAGESNTGQPILVPLVVLQGETDGPRMLVTAAVHGDELNGIRVIHKIVEKIDPSEISGRIIMIPGLNQPGLAANNRHFVGAGGGGFMVDLNRIFPGKTEKGGTAELYVGRIWEGAIKGHVDFAVDLHTQTRGTAYPLFVFADFRNEDAKAMAMALRPDMIKNDKGEVGTLETTLIKNGIPAVTFEIGEPKRFQRRLIDKAYWGLVNVMRLKGVLPGGHRSSAGLPFTGTHYVNVEARKGGVAILKVELGDRVNRGDLVAILFNSFGEEVDRYHAPQSGRVLAVATDPLREPGAMLVRILY